MIGVFQVVSINLKTGVAKVVKQDDKQVYDMYDPLLEVHDKFIITPGGIKILSRINQTKIEKILEG